MSPIRRILVAVKDPWARSLPAIEKATQLASALRARVQLFHALSNPLYIDVAEFEGVTLSKLEHTEYARAAARLEVLANRLEKAGVRVEATVEWDFPPHEAVIRAARRFDADLIVAERHASKHHLAWALRFTDFELLRLAPMPVLLVKTQQAYDHPAILAAVDRKIRLNADARLTLEVSRPDEAMRVYDVAAVDIEDDRAVPSVIVSAAWLMISMPEPHTRCTRWAGTSWATPAYNPMCRGNT